MKRIGNLYNKIYDYENLVLAFWKAQKGKRYKSEIIAFLSDFDNEIKSIQNEFENENLSIGNYSYFKIYEPKERNICATTFRERVIHHAIINICHYYFEKSLIHDTYACGINKGQHKAILRAKKNSNNNLYYLKMDIRKYFDSINHKILKNILHNKFKDKQLLSLLDKIIDLMKLNLIKVCH